MKQLLLIPALLMFSQLSMACLGEAEIMAAVQMVQPINSESCFVAINPNSVRFYSENQTCRLSLEEVLQGTVSIKATSNGTCPIHPGGEIGGILIKDATGKISLQ